MSKKHFEAIAKTLHTMHTETTCSAVKLTPQQYAHVCKTIANVLGGMNVKFNYYRFLEACGVD